jgi:hypothetical protein
MEVLDFNENEDGSATVTLNMTEEEQTILIQFAVTEMLKQEMERMKDEH